MTPINTAGTFECRVAAQTTHDPYFQVRGRDETDCICLVLETLDGSQHIKSYSYLSPNAAPYTKRNLNHLFGDDWIDRTDDGEDPFAGVEVQVVTEIEYYNGKPQCRVKYLNKPGSSGAPMAHRKVSAVLQALRKTKLPEDRSVRDSGTPVPTEKRSMSMKDLEGPGQAPRRPAAPALPKHEDEDDDIPF
jgi:hypothetical protein